MFNERKGGRQTKNQGKKIINIWKSYDMDSSIALEAKAKL